MIGRQTFFGALLTLRTNCHFYVFWPYKRQQRLNIGYFPTGMLYLQVIYWGCSRFPQIWRQCCEIITSKLILTATHFADLHINEKAGLHDSINTSALCFAYCREEQSSIIQQTNHLEMSPRATASCSKNLISIQKNTVNTVYVNNSI